MYIKFIYSFSIEKRGHEFPKWAVSSLFCLCAPEDVLVC
jgi:hypothetical protein